jgi:hypothetical protein
MTILVIFLVIMFILLLIGGIVLAIFWPTISMDFERGKYFSKSFIQNAAPAGLGVCPDGYTSLTTGYCVLSEADAIKACITSNSCLGYISQPSESNVYLVDSYPVEGNQAPWIGAVFWARKDIPTPSEETIQERDKYFTASASQNQWAATATGSCPTGYKSLVDSGCVLTEQDAINACIATTNCTGYLKPQYTTSQVYQPTGSMATNSVLLVQSAPVPTNNAMYNNIIYYQKKTNGGGVLPVVPEEEVGLMPINPSNGNGGSAILPITVDCSSPYIWNASGGTCCMPNTTICVKPNV